MMISGCTSFLRHNHILWLRGVTSRKNPGQGEKNEKQNNKLYLFTANVKLMILSGFFDEIKLHY